MNPGYLLDLATLAELTRPTGNRRVHTLFRQRQTRCMLAAPTLYALNRGVDALPSGQRQTQLRNFIAELLRSGPEVLPFDLAAATWLSQEHLNRRGIAHWSELEGQVAAIAAVNQLTLVTHRSDRLRGMRGLQTDDWFRP